MNNRALDHLRTTTKSYEQSLFLGLPETLVQNAGVLTAGPQPEKGGNRAISPQNF